MPIKILMPALSPTMGHGNLAKWIKKEGDAVKAGDVIAEIETDKATMEVEAVEEGTIARILVSEGAADVPVNTLIAVLIEEGEDQSSVDEFIKTLSPEKITVSSSSPVDNLKIEPEKLTAGKNIGELSNTNTPIVKNEKIFASPLAKRIAQIQSVNLGNIIGSGPHGRIVKADILAYINNGRGNKGSVIRNPVEYRAVPNNNTRKIIAKRLLESKITVPHFYLSIECHMDELLATRSQINDSLGDAKDKKLSINDFIILASAKALKDVPAANASWSEEAIKLYNNIDISVAVAIDGGLITPIIHNADQKDITRISAEMKDLAGRARENTLKPEEFQGGGFTISNLGMYGIKNFNAIINPPQGCIIAVGASSKRPVCIDDKIEVRTITDVTLSCDHRVVDGAVGAQFLAAFKKYIEAPILMFI